MDAPNEIELLILSTAYSAKPFVVSEVPDKDWVAEVRRELAPVEAGDFFVYGSHDSDKVPANCKPLLIEAAMAFGTGHHGTTKGCLTALDNLFKSGFTGTNVVDIGCGTAVLAMAAALCWSGKVLASDIDEIATETSKANAHANGLGDRIEVITCAGFDHPDLNASAPYDLILANILKGPLVALAPDMSKNSILGGYIILSGLLTMVGSLTTTSLSLDGGDGGGSATGSGGISNSTSKSVLLMRQILYGSNSLTFNLIEPTVIHWSTCKNLNFLSIPLSKKSLISVSAKISLFSTLNITLVAWGGRNTSIFKQYSPVKSINNLFLSI
jgi:ribosomal protein L11 methyltransferase